jgi:hypothetical protein
MSLRRTNPGWRGGRGAKKYSFTAATIGQALGLSTERVRELIRQRAFDPTDLLSLARFVVARADRVDARAAAAVLAAARAGTVRAGADVLGVSRASVYRRARRVTSGEA